MKSFSQTVPRLGKATAGLAGGAVKSAGSSSLMNNVGVKPKMGGSSAANPMKSGALKSVVKGASFGKAKVSVGPKGMAKGLINR